MKGLAWYPLCLVLILLLAGLVALAPPPEGAQQPPRNQFVLGLTREDGRIVLSLARGREPVAKIFYEPFSRNNWTGAMVNGFWIVCIASFIGDSLDFLFGTAVMHDLCTVGGLVPENWVGFLLGLQSIGARNLSVSITVMLYIALVALMMY